MSQSIRWSQSEKVTRQKSQRMGYPLNTAIKDWEATLLTLQKIPLTVCWILYVVPKMKRRENGFIKNAQAFDWTKLPRTRLVWHSPHQSVKKNAHLTFHKVGMSLSSGTFPDLQGSALYQIFHNTEWTSEINSMMQFDWIPLQVILCGHQWPLYENADSRTKGKDREKSRMGVLTLLFLLRGQQQGRERGKEWLDNGPAQIMWGHVSFSLSCLSVWPEKQPFASFYAKNPT